MHRWIGGIAVALLLLGVGVGCGGGSGESSSDITKPQFIKKAAAVCAESSRQREGAAEKIYKAKTSGGTLSADQAKEIGEEVLQTVAIPSLKEEQEELESLDLPAEDEDKIEKMWESLSTAVDEIEEEGYAGLQDANQFDPFEEETEKYGLNCQII